ncbi:hypothetical protein BC567DRAFT_212968 [Phyllosticta citribraziliensis]
MSSFPSTSGTRTCPTFRCVSLAMDFATGLRFCNTQQTQLLVEAHDLEAIYNARQHEQPSTRQRNQVTALRLARMPALLDPAVGHNLQVLLQRAAEVRRQLDAMAEELNSVEHLHVNRDPNDPRDCRDTAATNFAAASPL